MELPQILQDCVSTAVCGDREVCSLADGTWLSSYPWWGGTGLIILWLVNYGSRVQRS